MDDYLNFRKMITPVVIKVIFWIGVGLCVISGLIAIVTSFGPYGDVSAIITGLVTMILGPVVVRIYCEILIIIFRINDTLTEIKEALTKK